MNSKIEYNTRRMKEMNKKSSKGAGSPKPQRIFYENGEGSTSGWIFVLKEGSRELRLSDKDELNPKIQFKDNVKKPPGYRKERLEKIVTAIHEGQWISNYSLLELIKTQKLYCHRITTCKIKWMAEMDIKSDIIRHKNYRTGNRRRDFDGIFNVFENVVEKTLDMYIQIKNRRSQ